MRYPRDRLRIPSSPTCAPPKARYGRLRKMPAGDLNRLKRVLLEAFGCRGDEEWRA